MKNLILLLVLAVPAFAQTTYVKSICFTDGTGTPTNNCITASGFTKMNPTGAFAPLGPFDASASTVSIPWTTGLLANRPACTRDGQVYFATDIFLGQNIYMCVATVWQKMRINNDILSNVTNSYSAGAKQTFVPSTTTAGLQLSCVTADPNTLSAGDLWCRSDTKVIKFYDGTTTQSFALSGAFVPTGVDANSSGQVTGLHLPTTRSGDVIYYNGTVWTELAGNNVGTSNTLWFLGEGPTGVPAFSTNLNENTSTNTLRYAGAGGTSAPIVNADTTVSVGAGDSSCGSATGCFGATEASTTGSALAGHDYIRANSSTHQFAISTNGGPENLVPQATNTGVSGQIPISNGDGTYTNADPNISVNTMTLFPAGTSATGTATSSAISDPLRSNQGTLVIVGTGITGSPSGCSIALSYQQSSSGVSAGAAFATQSFTPGVSYQSFVIAPASPTEGDNVVAVYACSVYPSAGTLAVSFNPAMPTANYSNTAQTVNITAVNAWTIKGSGAAPVSTDSANVVMIRPDQPQLTTPMNIVSEPSTTSASSDAVSPCNILSGASTNATSCKSGITGFYGYDVYNTTTTVYYLRLYNANAAPTCSSATGFIRTIPLVPGASAGLVGGSISNQTYPVSYSLGLGYCITGGSSSTDNTNAAVGIFGEIRYK